MCLLLQMFQCSLGCLLELGEELHRQWGETFHDAEVRACPQAKVHPFKMSLDQCIKGQGRNQSNITLQEKADNDAHNLYLS